MDDPGSPGAQYTRPVINVRDTQTPRYTGKVSGFS